jgi:hypothetical protein
VVEASVKSGGADGTTSCARGRQAARAGDELRARPAPAPRRFAGGGGCSGQRPARRGLPGTRARGGVELDVLKGAAFRVTVAARSGCAAAGRGARSWWQFAAGHDAPRRAAPVVGWSSKLRIEQSR